MKHLISLISIVVIIISLSTTAHAQNGGDYMDGLQLMRQAKYEEAYTIFNRLLRENPNNYPVFDQLITTLINLKRYDEAIRLAETRMRGNYADVVLATRLAELYHLNDEVEKAYMTWERTLGANSNALQAYRYVADNMTSRREHAKAIEVYLAARNNFSNNSLFFSEITSNYMALGVRDKAVETLIDVLKFSPGNGSFVLRQIITIDDSIVTELAIVELDERIRSTTVIGPEQTAYREILIGLLMEQRLFRRALSTARNYESNAPEGSWPVFSLATRLRSQQQFELADEALSYYINQAQHPLVSRSLEERATLYTTWSRHLTEYNLDYDDRVTLLNKAALESLDRLIVGFPNYPRRIEVLSLKAELLIDISGDVDQAESIINEIRRISFNNEHRIIADYLDGRVNMFRGFHSLARISFTRANREARTGEMAEKTRYYLALNDFYTGDFEFASLQMRTLERLSTSYYANDALKLRVWIREGSQAETPTEQLKIFARARFLFDTHQRDEALNVLEPIITTDHSIPLRADALLMVSEHLRTTQPAIVFHLLDMSLPQLSGALAERLHWEKNRLAEGIFQQPEIAGNDIPAKMTAITEWLSSTDRLRQSNRFDGPITPPMLQATTSFDASRLYQMYEDMLFNFPNGFYANAVRERMSILLTPAS